MKYYSSELFCSNVRNKGQQYIDGCIHHLLLKIKVKTITSHISLQPDCHDKRWRRAFLLKPSEANFI